MPRIVAFGAHRRSASYLASDAVPLASAARWWQGRRPRRPSPISQRGRAARPTQQPRGDLGRGTKPEEAAKSTPFPPPAAAEVLSPPAPSSPGRTFHCSASPLGPSVTFSGSPCAGTMPLQNGKCAGGRAVSLVCSVPVPTRRAGGCSAHAHAPGSFYPVKTANLRIDSMRPSPLAEVPFNSETR